MPQTQELTRFLNRLRQVREYTAEAVPEDVLRDIAEVGRQSGSGSNKQPWAVVVVRDRGLMQKMGEWGARPAAGAAATFLIVMDENSSQLDEGRLAERLMLGAAAHGLGAGIATLKNEGPDAIKPLLGIPADKRSRTVVSVGHTDREARKALPKTPGGSRKPLDEFARWDRF
jgi:nitroreductase